MATRCDAHPADENSVAWYLYMPQQGETSLSFGESAGFWWGMESPEPWEIELAASLKSKTTATNRWLGENLKLAALHEVSRKLSVRSKQSKT